VNGSTVGEMSVGMDLGWRVGVALLGLLFAAMALTGPHRTRKNRCSTEGALSSFDGAASRRAGRTARPQPQPIVFSRQERSLIYTASCPIHEPTDDPNSRGLWLTWDMDTGMAHCLWCGWGGRLARPLAGRIHPRFFPKVFRMAFNVG
jgi:hypothetical protein